MPSPNPRIQVAASPDLYAQIKTLAKARNVTLSNMVQELCLHALKTDNIRAEYQHACETYGEVPVQEDRRVRPESRPWVKNYVDDGEPLQGPRRVPDGLSFRQKMELVQAKKEGRMSKDQEKAAQEAVNSGDSNKKKELLLSVLRELMEE